MSERILHRLDNGLRIVAERIDGNVSYIGILTGAGSRDDFEGRDGLAHFVEHTFFKGTVKRKSAQVSNRMESVGGELNAYTTKEEIMLYSNLPAGYESRAIELLADLVCHATFPQVEIDRERGVILEEILSYRDNASYAVFDEFEELIYKDSRLAHNILGYEKSVKNIGRNDASEFVNQRFNPSNMVMYCCGPSDPARNIRTIERYFGSLLRPATTAGRRSPDMTEPFDETRKRDNHQANVVIGSRIFSYKDPRRYALLLFANMLGGPAMNSVLNRELRDRRGLVYTIDANPALYSDAGTLQIYFACEPGNVNKCSNLIKKEIDKLADGALTERRFQMARRQICGQLLVSSNHREAKSMGYAKSLLRFGEVTDQKHTTEMLMNLKRSDVEDMARLIADSPSSRLILI